MSFRLKSVTLSKNDMRQYEVSVKGARRYVHGAIFLRSTSVQLEVLVAINPPCTCMLALCIHQNGKFQT